MEGNRKIPFYSLEIGGKSYMLRLTAGAAVRLEERLGCSVYEGAKRLNEITVVTEFLYALIEGFMPEITRSCVYLLFDEYINEGGTVRKLNNIIAQVLDRSGFFDCGGEAKQQES